MQPLNELDSEENSKRRSSHAAGCAKVQTVSMSSMKFVIGASHIRARSRSTFA